MHRTNTTDTYLRFRIKEDEVDSYLDFLERSGKRRKNLALGIQTPVQRVISSVIAVYLRVTIVTSSVNGNGIILGM